MNREVYKHLLRSYGRSKSQWVGLISEVIRTLMSRIWLTIIMAQLAASIAAGNTEAAKRYTYLFLMVSIVSSIISAVGELMAVRSENRIYNKLLLTFYRKLTGKDMAFYRDHQTGYLASIFRQYLDSAILLVRFLRGDATRVFISLTAPVIVLLIVDWRIGLIALAVVITQIGYIFWSSAKANAYRAMSHEIYRKVTGEVSDEITNIVAFKSGGIEREANSRMARLADEEIKTFWLRRKTTILLDLPRNLITGIGVTAAFLVIASTSRGDASSIGLIVLTITYMFQIIRNVSELPNLIVQHDDLVTKLYPTLQYLSDDEKIRDPENPRVFNVHAGAINIDHVSFRYSGLDGQNKGNDIFKDLQIFISGGEHVGIVGLSGAGKTTLANLLMRFDDITEGSIKIDDIDIREIKQDDLRQKIAYVPQEPLLFHRSVKENIAYYKRKADFKDIVKSAKAAHAHNFITKLPEGYDTIVGERGVKLSGGQKQRIAIARSALKNAPILIFDEATSALDSESEKIIQKALPEIMGRHTAVIIAHRLSTVSGLDRIIVMDEGKIIEEGTHQELVNLKGRYYSLWQKQTNSE